MLTLRENLSSPRYFGGVRVAHLFTFFSCPILCLFVLSSMLWCPLRFPHKAMFGSTLPPIVAGKAHVLFTLFVFVFVWWCRKHILNIWVAWWVSYKSQELFVLRATLVQLGFFVGSMFLVFCVALLALFVCVLCLVYTMLPASLDPEDFRMIWFSHLLTLNLLVLYFTFSFLQGRAPIITNSRPRFKTYFYYLGGVPSESVY